MKSKVSIWDTVRNTGICLATGAFHTSQIDHLYVESGEPSFSLRRNLLLCSYTAKLATQPNCPSYSPIFHPATATDIDATHMMPLSGVCFKKFLQCPNVHLLRIVTIRLLPLPPWQIVWPACSFRLLKHTKGSTSALRPFAELYSDYTAIYTYRPLLHGSTGCAFIY
jgi:hypothetical protein